MKSSRSSLDIAQKPKRKIVQKALYELQTALQELYRQDAPLVLVYGSYARKDANAASDTDVLLLYPKNIQPGLEIQRLSSILADLNLRYQVLISVLPVNKIVFEQTASPFWQNIRQEGIPIDAI